MKEQRDSARAKQPIKTMGMHLGRSVARSEVEAEILKLYNNTYASLRIVFANLMYDLSAKYNANYDIIKNAYVKTDKTSGKYLNVNENLRGYSGACLPKDTVALMNLIDKLNMDYDLIKSVHNDNSKLPKN